MTTTREDLCDELLAALTDLLAEAEDIFICMTDATGIDRYNYPHAIKVAQALVSRLERAS